MKSSYKKIAIFAITALLFISQAMAAVGFSTALRTARADSITSTTGSAATLKIYTATQPATCAAITSQTLLVTFTMGTPFAAGATAGVLTVTLPSATPAGATGTGTWARLATSGGTCVMDSAVTATGGGAPITFNSTSFTSGVNASLTSFTITEGNP